MRIARATFLAVALIVARAPAATADLYAETDPYRDAGEVDLIVEGRVIGADRVNVLRVLFSKTPLPETREVRVDGLSRHDRGVGLLRGEKSRARIDAGEVLLLLDATKQEGTWRPHHLILEDSSSGGDYTGGATGTFWVKDGTAWGYSQEMNPGPYVFRSWGTAEALRAEIAKGLEARRAWESDLALADPVARARRLLRWLQPSTSPDGNRPHRRYAVREVLRGLGAPAVSVLVEALDPAFEDEARGEVLETLADLKG